MLHPLRRFALAVVLLGTVPAAWADETLLSNLPPLDDDAQGIVSSGTLRAVSFTTASTPFYVTTATLRLVNYISTTDTALLSLRLDDGGAPSDSIYALLIAPVSASNTVNNFVFTTTSAVTLAGNTTYWLVIAATSNTETFSWTRPEDPVTPTGIATFGVQAISEDSGAEWSDGGSGPHSFAINGVPEPSTALLCGLGLAGVLFSRRFRRNASSQG